MVLPRHVDWNTGDPKYKGDFNTRITETIALTAASANANIEAAHICFIYRMIVETSASNAYTVKLYGKSGQSATDLIFDSGSQTGNYLLTNDLVVYVDEDGGNEIHATIEGTSGDSFDLILDMVRLA